MKRRRMRALFLASGVAAGLALLLALAAWLALEASLPRLDGEVPLAGLGAEARIERDADGVPVIRGATREDVSRATGYAHGQDRFFQMDLLRRTSAGELAELLGAALLDTDRKVRLHQFRKRAVRALAALNPAERALFDAYAAGVNAALADGRLRPFEYLLLRTEPNPWRAEDSLLVVYTMWIDLQGLEARGEQQRDRLAAALPEALYDLVTAADPEWEAPLDGSRSPQAPLPDPQRVDLRTLDRALFDEKRAGPEAGRNRRAELQAGGLVGSNNWAVAGGRTASGRALVANDMHLGLRVPNIWYRARFVVESMPLDVSGVSLPGIPAIVAGSNGNVAWGFTNSYGDFQDLIALEPGPAGGDSYLTAGGERRYQTDIEVLHVAGGPDDKIAVRGTIWGPVIGKTAAGNDMALAWTAHRPEATDMALLGMERALNLDEAAAIIGGAGMPAQNVLIGDASGRIGWVLSGRLPRRRGFDPALPSAWHLEGTGWDGWVAPADSPRLLDPAEGRAWSANARVVGGEMRALIGDGDYAPAMRARQIRDRLATLGRATTADMIAMQLDDRADYLANWQPILRRALAQAGAQEADALVASWSGRAAVDDAGYRLLREFARRVSDRSYRMLTIQARSRWPDFSWRTPERFTEVAWRLIHEQPMHLLDPRFADWDAWLADVAVETVRKLPDQCADLAGCGWGRVNRVRIQHPLSQALPALARLLDMPSQPLPGDWSMPRVQSPEFGASERFAVSPGLEREGYLHMPGGQSGHVLSPFYRAGHDAWARGEPTPFLPGPAQHVLALVPATH